MEFELVRAATVHRTCCFPPNSEPSAGQGQLGSLANRVEYRAGGLLVRFVEMAVAAATFASA
jgi:hypothetical protein